MKIGIYGGSFNPPHKTHVEIAKRLLSAGVVDEIRIVPTNNDYAKQGLVDIEKRTEMLKMCFAGISRVKITPCKESYTVDVLNFFQSKNPDDKFFFIMGSDNLKQFKTWKNWEEILKNYKLIVILRDGDSAPELQSHFRGTEIIFIDAINDFSSSEVRSKLVRGIKPYEISEKTYDFVTKSGIYIKK